MKKAINIISAITLLIVVLISNPSFGQKKMKSPKAKAAISAATLKTNMGKLWEDHITCTRNVILCLIGEQPGTDEALKRLFKNQVDIGNTFKIYYGNEVGGAFTKLLYHHVTISTEVIHAAKSGNAATLQVANDRWYANADEISVFLCNANPNLALVDMKMMMNDHLKLTTEEAEQCIKKNYKASVMAYDKVHIKILQMSDMLADGIAKQFPEKFKTRDTKLALKPE